LSIAKWGVEAHGGHLELICPANSGCVFRFVLPKAAATNGKVASEAVIHVSNESEYQQYPSLATFKVSSP
jgi:hypothetical protein